MSWDSVICNPPLRPLISGMKLHACRMNPIVLKYCAPRASCLRSPACLWYRSISCLGQVAGGFGVPSFVRFNFEKLIAFSLRTGITVLSEKRLGSHADLLSRSLFFCVSAP